MDEKTASYFASGRHKIVKVSPEADFMLKLVFDNDEIRLLDMKPVIKPNTVFAFLNNPNNFAKVYIDNTNNICWDKDPTVNSEVVWDNKVDISSDSCYLDSVPIQ